MFTLHDLHFQTLTLSNNRIATLSPYVFPLLKHLKSIDLSHNLIDEVQRNTFENLGNSVESLNLDNNRIGSLKEEVFLPLTNLKSLQVCMYMWINSDLKNWLAIGTHIGQFFSLILQFSFEKLQCGFSKKPQIVLWLYIFFSIRF